MKYSPLPCGAPQSHHDPEVLFGKRCSGDAQGDLVCLMIPARRRDENSARTASCFSLFN